MLSLSIEGGDGGKHNPVSEPELHASAEPWLRSTSIDEILMMTQPKVNSVKALNGTFDDSFSDNLWMPLSSLYQMESLRRVAGTCGLKSDRGVMISSWMEIYSSIGD